MNEWTMQVERLCPATAASLGMLRPETREACELAFVLDRALDGLQHRASWHPLEQRRVLNDYRRFLEDPSDGAGRELLDRWPLASPVASAEAQLLRRLPDLGAALRTQTHRPMIQQRMGDLVGRVQGFAMRSRPDGTIALRDVSEVGGFLGIRAGIPAGLFTDLLVAQQPNLAAWKDKLGAQVSALAEGALLVRLIDDSSGAVSARPPFGDLVGPRDLAWLAVLRGHHAKTVGASMGLGRIDRSLAASLALYGAWLQNTLDRLVFVYESRRHRDGDAFSQLASRAGRQSSMPPQL